MYVTLTSSTATQNTTTGDWVQGSVSDPVAIECRYEPAGGNGLMITEAGKQFRYNGIAYMLQGVQELPEGAQVEIKNAGVTLVKDTIKLFSRGQLNARAWV
jgi:hypothetical protein